MAPQDGRSAINKFFISLLVLGAIACGAIYLVLTPVLSGPPPIPNRMSEPSRPLAYQQKIVRSDPAESDEAKPENHAMAPADAALPSATPAPAQDSPAAAPEEGAETAPPADDMAALPPDDGAAANDPDSLPWQQSRRRDDPAGGMNDDAADPRAQHPGQYDDPSHPMAALPGENDDPNAWPEGPQDEPQEWVQVLVSGAGMQATPSDDAPALFAFPYGRTLRVVSRYQGWVEVTDPQSAATGWMKAQYLAPTSPPGMRQEHAAEQNYDEDMPRWKRRWLRRHGGGLGDLIGRAIEGDF